MPRPLRTIHPAAAALAALALTCTPARPESPRPAPKPEAAPTATPAPTAGQAAPDGPSVPAAPETPPPACATPEHRQFDFWVGDWEVFLPDGARAGGNSIRLIMGDCALLENWSGARGIQGTSLNIYDRADGRWHQAWVDGSGTRLALAGGLRGGAMVLSGETRAPGGRAVVDRITWEPRPDGTVRQLWEQSSDGGTTFTVVFDGRYVRRGAGSG